MKNRDFHHDLPYLDERYVRQPSRESIARNRQNSTTAAITMPPAMLAMSLPMPPSVLIGVSSSRPMVPVNVGSALGYVAADMCRASNQKHQNQDFHGQKTIHLIDTRKQPVNGNQEMN